MIVSLFRTIPTSSTKQLPPTHTVYCITDLCMRSTMLFSDWAEAVMGDHGHVLLGHAGHLFHAAGHHGHGAFLFGGGFDGSV